MLINSFFKNKMFKIGSSLVLYDNKNRDCPIVKEILSDPDGNFFKGVPVSSGRLNHTTSTVKVELFGKSYFLKKYLEQGFFYKIKSFFRYSKALKAYRMGKLLLSYGIPTPDPILCLERRHKGLLYDAFLVTPFISNTQNLLNVWPKLSGEQRIRVMEEVGSLLRKMYLSGILHGDLNWRNILIRFSDENNCDISFVDLDGSSFVKKFKPDRVKRDLLHFRRDMDRAKVSSFMKDIFNKQLDFFAP